MTILRFVLYSILRFVLYSCDTCQYGVHQNEICTQIFDFVKTS